MIDGDKSWFVVALKPALRKLGERTFYIRGRGYDTLELATWFDSRGEALDEVNRNARDPNQMDVIAIEIADGKIEAKESSWLGE